MTEKLSETDQKLFDELLQGATSIEAPPIETQLALLREQFALWNNTYFAMCTNLRIAHEAGIADLEQRYFTEAKQYRVAVEKCAAQIDALLAAHPELDRKG